MIKFLDFSGLTTLVANIFKKLDEKVNVKQGTDYAGKYMFINESGEIVPGNAPNCVSVTYHEDERMLEFVKSGDGNYADIAAATAILSELTEV